MRNSFVGAVNRPFNGKSSPFAVAGPAQQRYAGLKARPTGGAVRAAPGHKPAPRV